MAASVAADLAAGMGPGTRTPLVSSPRRRTVETAEAIAAACGIPSIDIDERWCEVDFGRVEGLTFDALSRSEPELAERLLAADTDIDWPGGETAQSLAERVHAALEELPADVIVVTHAGPIRVVLAQARGRPMSELALPEPGAIVHLDSVGGPDAGPPRATLRP